MSATVTRQPAHLAFPVTIRPGLALPVQGDCPDCGRAVIPTYCWRQLDRDLRAGLSPTHSGGKSGVCESCRRRRERARRRQDDALPAVDPEILAEARGQIVGTCRACQAHLVPRKWAESHPPEVRRALSARRLRYCRSSHTLCPPCDAKRARGTLTVPDHERPVPGWQARGLCVRLGIPGDDLTPSVCAQCPVRQLCLADALATETGGAMHRYGIRGGLDPTHRAALARQGAVA